MSVELGPPAEREVFITLKESDAALLTNILRFVYGDNDDVCSEIIDLKGALESLCLKDIRGRKGILTSGGVRVYDGTVEW